jgi:DNA-binding NarL/FixJ family response regulator
MAKILISDDHPFTLMGTKAYVQSLGHYICEMCSNGISAHNMILKHEPEIALLDMSMPGMNGLEILEKLQAKTPPLHTKVILLTMHKEMSVFKRAQALNVRGYVLKEFSTDVLEDCINAVLRGETWFSQELTENLHIDVNAETDDVLNKLTFAEKKVVELIGRQHTTKEIANLLFVAEKTIENHRYNIMKKLNLPAEKNALLVWAIQNMPKM